jgi:GNAT superfamily N-acetyltransferase
VQVRDARPDDWPGVADLLAELGRPDVRGREDEAEHRKAFAGYVERCDTLALVAEEGGELLGFVDLEFRQRLNTLNREAWIPDLVVAERARGRGIGRALMGKAEERARAAGCFGLSLETAGWRTDTHAFYEHVGWTDSGKYFTRSLTDIQWPPAPR